jgi:peptidoglycan/xylan/chitin deacetylase (PgdA/CDA1 family)
MKRVYALIIGIFLVFQGLAFSEDQPVPILMYHSVASGRQRDLILPPTVFQKHLDYLQEHGYNTTTFEEVRAGRIPPKPVILTFDDGTLSHWWVFCELSKRNMTGVFFIPTKSIGSKKYLNRYQIETMAFQGMEIGAHTVSHPYLTKISYDRLLRELKDSKETLEQITKKTVITFAYPYGIYDLKVIDAVWFVGYHYARTTDEGVSVWGQSRNYRLKIIYIHRRTVDLKKWLK